MNEYQSNEPIWFDPSDQINNLNKKSLLIELEDDSMEGQILIESGKPDSIHSGKVSVKFRQPVVPVSAWTKVGQTNRPSPESGEKISRIGHSDQYLTENSLGLICPYNQPSPPHAELLLVLPIE